MAPKHLGDLPDELLVRIIKFYIQGLRPHLLVSVLDDPSTSNGSRPAAKKLTLADPTDDERQREPRELSDDYTLDQILAAKPSGLPLVSKKFGLLFAEAVCTGEHLSLHVSHDKDIKCRDVYWHHITRPPSNTRIPSLLFANIQHLRLHDLYLAPDDTPVTATLSTDLRSLSLFPRLTVLELDYARSSSLSVRDFGNYDWLPWGGPLEGWNNDAPSSQHHQVFLGNKLRLDTESCRKLCGPPDTRNFTVAWRYGYAPYEYILPNGTTYRGVAGVLDVNEQDDGDIAFQLKVMPDYEPIAMECKHDTRRWMHFRWTR